MSNLFDTGTFQEYLALLKKRPEVAESAYQRLHRMILSFGTEEYEDGGEKFIHYKFFDDPVANGKLAVYGLDNPLMQLMHILESAARRLGADRRILLLHGPVGSSKSTIVRLMKKGLEKFSRTDKGVMYTFGWKLDAYFSGNEKLKEKQAHLLDSDVVLCPLHEDPLHLIPEGDRVSFLKKNKIDPEKVYLEGNLCPLCQMVMNRQLKLRGGWQEVVREDVVIQRLYLSEDGRMGIGTFQPKDEKNQDSTELTGDINYYKIALYGSDSDPRAFNFDGEFEVANRGILELIELLKLETAFLYDLLEASQFKRIKPKKFPQIFIDEVIVGHTNEPEFKKLQADQFMEAFRDRTLKIDIPYVLRLQDEIKIYERDFGKDGSRFHGKHIAPHTIEVAAMWAVLTRLKEPNQDITLIQKLRLYDGQQVAGFTSEEVRELRDPREGMEGISPRYIQDKISNALVKYPEECINPFMVLNEIGEGLDHYSLISDEDSKALYRELIAEVKNEYADIVKSEVQRAIAADEEALNRLAANYLDNVKAYTQGERIKNKYTGVEEEPNEQLMRSVEEKIDISENRKDEFRREIMNYIGALAIEGKKFDYRQNARLKKALELKLFEDQKDSIKLSSLVSAVVDKDTQEKIDIVKARMIKEMGYCDVCASNVLSFVASIFARGDIKED